MLLEAIDFEIREPLEFFPIGNTHRLGMPVAESRYFIVIVA
jgi:hypothetical protein